jgi:hypothetical protein
MYLLFVKSFIWILKQIVKLLLILSYLVCLNIQLLCVLGFWGERDFWWTQQVPGAHSKTRYKKREQTYTEILKENVKH